MNKQEKGIKELFEMLENDDLSIELIEDDNKGKCAKSDLALSYKGLKYGISVKRARSVSNSTQEKWKSSSEILMIRGDRQDWKVYMDLKTLILLLLNKRS